MIVSIGYNEPSIGHCMYCVVGAILRAGDYFFRDGPGGGRVWCGSVDSATGLSVGVAACRSGVCVEHAPSLATADVLPGLVCPASGSRVCV